MSQRSFEMGEEPPRPRTDHLITETGEAVDSVLSEKQMRLLTAPLNGAWSPGRPFVAMANVGLFFAPKNPALVPDVLVSLDVTLPALTGPESISSYFVWELGKVPDIVIEIVSKREGGELRDKLRAYERMHVPHYVVFDPLRRLGARELTVFSMDGGVYTERDELRFVTLGLALTLWEGSFEGSQERWLRWTDLSGHLFPTIKESIEDATAARAEADSEKARADSEKARADGAQAQAESEKARAEALSEKLRALEERLRALSVDPDAT